MELEAELLTGEDAPRTVVAVSKMVAADLALRYPSIEGRIVVVPNGVDLDRFSPAEREPGGVITFLAGNPRLKGVDVAVEVFRRLREAGLAESLIVAGGNPGGLSAGKYVGATEHPERLLSETDLLLHPTRYDPFPLVVLEALACGTPVVTTERNGALDHVGRDGPVRAVADPTDIEAFVAAATELLKEAPRAAARSVAERFPVGESYAAAAALLTPGRE